jgi:hypothetical protein
MESTVHRDFQPRTSVEIQSWAGSVSKFSQRVEAQIILWAETLRSLCTGPEFDGPSFKQPSNWRAFPSCCSGKQRQLALSS